LTRLLGCGLAGGKLLLQRRKLLLSLISRRLTCLQLIPELHQLLLKLGDLLRS